MCIGKTKVSPSCSMDSDSSSLDQFMSSNESSCSSEGNDESTFMCVNSESSLDDNFDEMLYSNKAAWKKYNSPVDPQSNKGSQVNTLIKKTTLRSTSVDAVDQMTKTADENVGEADTSETISANASNPESLHMLLQEVTTHTDEELAMDISHNRTKSLLSTEPPVWHAAESTVLPPANNVTTRDTIHSTVSSDEDDDTVAVNGKKKRRHHRWHKEEELLSEDQDEVQQVTDGLCTGIIRSNHKAFLPRPPQS